MSNTPNLSIQEAKIQERLAALRERLQKVQADRQKTYQKDFAEQATERENDEVLDEIASETLHTIRLLENALQRIERGDYGVCEKCGESISSSRLEVIPEARLCINCQE